MKNKTAIRCLLNVDRLSYYAAWDNGKTTSKHNDLGFADAYQFVLTHLSNPSVDTVIITDPQLATQFTRRGEMASTTLLNTNDRIH